MWGYKSGNAERMGPQYEGLHHEEVQVAFKRLENRYYTGCNDYWLIRGRYRSSITWGNSHRFPVRWKALKDLSRSRHRTMFSG